VENIHLLNSHVNMIQMLDDIPFHMGNTGYYLYYLLHLKETQNIVVALYYLPVKPTTISPDIELFRHNIIR